MGFHLKSGVESTKNTDYSKKENRLTNLAILTMAIAFPLSPLFWVVVFLIGLVTGNLTLEK